MSKKIIFIFISLMLILNSYIYANYKNVGSIDFIAINNSTSKKIPDLTVDVYQIGETYDGNFTVNDLYKNVDLNDYSEANIEKIKEIAIQNDKPVLTKTTDKDGKINFENINLGVYLFVQSNKFDEIEMQTMFVKIPESNEDGLDYEITIKPKISIIQKDIEKNEEENLDSKIPYTGVLNWPIPVLAVIAILVLFIGWNMIYSKKNKKKVN